MPEIGQLQKVRIGSAIIEMPSRLFAEMKKNWQDFAQRLHLDTRLHSDPFSALALIEQEIQNLARMPQTEQKWNALGQIDLILANISKFGTEILSLRKGGQLAASKSYLYFEAEVTKLRNRIVRLKTELRQRPS